MSRATLATAKNSRIPQVVGGCKDGAKFASYLNEAQERLITRGNWKGSYQKIRLCIDEGCITLPLGILGLHGVAMCNYPVTAKNQWWEFLSNEHGIVTGNSEVGCAFPGNLFLDRGFHPTFRDIKPPNKQIRAYLTNTADVGKKIHIFGVDEYNNTIRSTISGNTVDGFYLTLANPFVANNFDVKSITGVQKEVTKGQVLLYAVDTGTGVETQLGIYEPEETVADYRRYFMTGIDDSCSCTVKTIEAMAKLDFIPVKNDWDYLYIDNIPALKEMCQAIRYSEMDTGNSKQQALVHEARAIRELNHQKRNITPDSQIPISMRVYGSARLSNKRIGGLT